MSWSLYFVARKEKAIERVREDAFVPQMVKDFIIAAIEFQADDVLLNVESSGHMGPRSQGYQNTKVTPLTILE